MKNVFLSGAALLLLTMANAQQKEGKVTYERTVQMQVSFSGMNEEMQRMIPKTRTDKFELFFGNDQSLWRQAEQENEDDHTFGNDGGGMQVRMVVAGSNDVLFTHLSKGTRVEKREVMDKVFIIDDSTKALKWKISGESKTILFNLCGHGHLDLQAYNDYFDGKLQDHYLTEEELKGSLKELADYPPVA